MEGGVFYTLWPFTQSGPNFAKFEFKVPTCKNQLPEMGLEARMALVT